MIYNITSFEEAVYKAVKEIEAYDSAFNKSISSNTQLSTSQSTVKLTAQNIDYFDPTATAEGLIYNNVFEFRDRLEIYVQQ